VSDLNVLLPQRKELESSIKKLEVSIAKQEGANNKLLEQKDVLNISLKEKRDEEKALKESIKVLTTEIKELRAKYEKDETSLISHYSGLEGDLDSQIRSSHDELGEVLARIDKAKEEEDKANEEVSKIKEAIKYDISEADSKVKEVEEEIKELKVKVKELDKEISVKDKRLLEQTNLDESKVEELKIRERNVSTRERNLLIIKARLDKYYRMAFPNQEIQL
jgi:chromosome segregation ATPase